MREFGKKRQQYKELIFRQSEHDACDIQTCTLDYCVGVGNSRLFAPDLRDIWQNFQCIKALSKFITDIYPHKKLSVVYCGFLCCEPGNPGQSLYADDDLQFFY